MIIDTSLVFSSQQAVTVSAPSTNMLDLGATGTPYGASVPLVRNVGEGARLDLAVTVASAFAGLTSLQVAVQTSPDGVTWTTVDAGEVAPASALAMARERVPARARAWRRRRTLRHSRPGWRRMRR